MKQADHKPDVDEPNQGEQNSAQEETPRATATLNKVLRTLINHNPIGQDAAEKTLEILFRLLNRREFLERVLRSEFMRNVRDMQSEITESVGLASQGDVQDIKLRLDEVTRRLEKLQKTLDEIVVEVDAP